VPGPASEHHELAIAQPGQKKAAQRLITYAAALSISSSQTARVLEARCPRVCQSGHRGQSPSLAGRRVNEPCPSGPAQTLQVINLRHNALEPGVGCWANKVGKHGGERRRLASHLGGGVDGAEPAPLKPAAPRRDHSQVLCVISTAPGSSKSRFWKGIASERLAAGRACTSQTPKPQIPGNGSTGAPVCPVLGRVSGFDAVGPFEPRSSGGDWTASFPRRYCHERRTERWAHRGLSLGQLILFSPAKGSQHGPGRGGYQHSAFRACVAIIDTSENLSARQEPGQATNNMPSPIQTRESQEIGLIGCNKAGNSIIGAW
jgi:hypothetical protein